MAKRKTVKAEIVDETKTLNPQQKRFVEEYTKDYNARAASIRAGYSPDGRNDGKLMANPAVKAAIEDIQARESAQYADIRKHIILNLYRIATDKECPEQHQINASKLLMQHFGMLTEKIETDNTLTINVAEVIKEIGQ